MRSLTFVATLLALLSTSSSSCHSPHCYFRHVGAAASFVSVRTTTQPNPLLRSSCQSSRLRRSFAAVDSKRQLSTFQAFEESVLDRIRESQRHDCDGAVQQVDVVVQMSRIQDALRHNETDKLQHMTKVMTENGGYLLIELDDDQVQQRRVLNNMWQCVIHNLSFPDASTSDNDNNMDKSAPLFRQQVLSRNDGIDEKANQPMSGGYQYIETSIRRSDGMLSIAGMTDTSKCLDAVLDSNSQDVVDAAFQLLSDVANSLVLMSCMSLQQETSFDLNTLTEALHRIIDAGEMKTDDLSVEDSLWSCTVHRLCRYSYTPRRRHDSHGNVEVESIRSHTDWTLTTLVPVSIVPGLEIWNPTTRKWVRPEVTAQRHWKVNAYEIKDGHSWNSRYVVVMAGKWLEILTSGKLTAAVHRVVTSSPVNHTIVNARMSAPFFLRPRNRIAIDVQKRFGAKSNDVFNRDDGARSAAARLNDFLQLKYF